MSEFFDVPSGCKRHQIPYCNCWILDERNVTILTQMYICTLKNLLEPDVFTLLHKCEVIRNGNYTGSYTNIWIDLRVMRITLRCHYLNCMDKCENWCQHETCHLRMSFMSCYCILYITTGDRYQLGNSLILLFMGKLLDAGETVECLMTRINLKLSYSKIVDIATVTTFTMATDSVKFVNDNLLALHGLFNKFS